MFAFVALFEYDVTPFLCGEIEKKRVATMKKNFGHYLCSELENIYVCERKNNTSHLSRLLGDVR